MSIYRICLIVVGLLVIQPYVLADLRLKLENRSTDLISIAVPPFVNKTGSKIPEDIAEIVTSDLINSGEFSPLSRSKLPQKEFSAESIKFEEWGMLKQDYLLLGQISKTGGYKYEISYELYDIKSQKKIAGEVRTFFKEREFRKSAHYISDEVLYYITEFYATASNKIAYVLEEKSHDGVRYTLNVSDSDGENSYKILSSKDSIGHLAWSNDHVNIAYSVVNKRGTKVFVAHNIHPIKYLFKDFTKDKTIKQIFGLSWSPDDSSIAFSINAVTGLKTAKVKIYRDGAEEHYKSYFNAPSKDSFAIYNEMQALYYSHTEDQVREVTTSSIHIFPLNGGKPTKTNYFDSIILPRWSPDGNTIAYSSINGMVYGLDLQTFSESRYTDTKEMNIIWGFSHNGEAIIFESGGEILEYNLLSEDTYQIGGFKQNNYAYPSLSKNKRIYFYQRSENEVVFESLYSDLKYTMSTDTGTSIKSIAW